MKLSTRPVIAALLVCSLICSGAYDAASSQGTSAADALPPDSLRDAPSLYLREASAGPVRWQQWSAASLALARKLDRPLLIDIGAVWCHWCHVMDQTTYTDPQVAELINDNYVPIKVDSDARPDIDSYFQAAAQEFGAGGWPLTCFATPAGEPLFIAGYLPPETSSSDPHALSMRILLPRVIDAYASDPKVASFAHQLAAQLASAPEMAPSSGAATLDTLRARILAGLSSSYDPQTGGFGGESGPRFFDFPALELALAHGFFGNRDYTAMAFDTLRKIAAGGVFDQLGGGVHRYSTDPQWRVPHFEKLLGDQALALDEYANAYAFGHDPEFAADARQIASYVNSTLLDSEQHFFYAHQDADSFAGDDGSYYTWTADEVRRACLDGASAAVALLYFGIDDAPAKAPDGRIVLRRAMSLDQIAARLKISKTEAAKRFARARTAMVAARERRKTPAVDHALLTDRNALMAYAYLDAAAKLRDPALANTALEDLEFILRHLRAPDGAFCHLWANERAEVPGLAADQVYLANALAAAYQVSGDPKYLSEARNLAALIESKFRDPKTGLLRNQSAVEDPALGNLMGGVGMLYDAPLPAPQAEAARLFATLVALVSDDKLGAISESLLAPAPALAGSAEASSMGALGLALEIRAHGHAVVAIAGNSRDARTVALRDAAFATYRPGKVVGRIDAARVKEGGTPAPIVAMYQAASQKDAPLAFVCAGTACARPTTDPNALAKTIATFATGTEPAASQNALSARH